jgi:hypothetical protein
MVGTSVIVAILSAILGYAGAARWNTSVAGMMAVAAGGLFGLAVLFAPQHGVVSKTLHQLLLALRIAREDVLAALYRAEEASREWGPVEGGWLAWLASLQLRRAGQIEPAGDGWRLTEAGRVEARELVRTHRLWETYFSTQLALPADHVHAPADRLEHYTDPALREQLDAELEHPQHDPHGMPSPVAEGEGQEGRDRAGG